MIYDAVALHHDLWTKSPYAYCTVAYDDLLCLSRMAPMYIIYAVIITPSAHSHRCDWL